MKIAIDGSRLTDSAKAGPANYALSLVSALKRVDKVNDYIIYLRTEPADFLKNNLFDSSPKFDYKVLKPSFPWTQLVLPFACLLDSPDILFLPDPTLPFWRPSGVKVVITVHDLGFEYLPQFRNFLQRALLENIPLYASRLAEKIIAVSEATKRDVTEKFSINPDKISTVYEGVDFERFQAPDAAMKEKDIKSKYDISGDYILFVGTVQPRKNLVRLIKAFSVIANGCELKQITTNKNKRPREICGMEESDKPLKLVIAGKRGWLCEEIYKAPRNFGVEDKVLFLDRVPSEDLPPLYRGARCFVFPSLFEGFGLPILEAMAAGTPVITSNISSMPEVGGEAVVYVNPLDVKDIAAGLQSVLINDSLRQKLVEKGMTRAKQFSWEKCAKETVAVFKSVLSGN